DGSPAPGQVAGVVVDGQSYAYRMRHGDTSALVAAALAAQIRTDRPANTVQATISLPGARGLAARVVADGIGGREVRRQEAGFRVTLWCPDPQSRDKVAGAVDIALAAVSFLDVGGWACRLGLTGGSSPDEGSGSGLWR